MATKNTRHARMRLTPLEVIAIRGAVQSLRLAEVLREDEFTSGMPSDKAADEFVAKLVRLGFLKGEGGVT